MEEEQEEDEKKTTTATLETMKNSINKPGLAHDSLCFLKNRQRECFRNKIYICFRFYIYHFSASILNGNQNDKIFRCYVLQTKSVDERAHITQTCAHHVFRVLCDVAMETPGWGTFLSECCPRSTVCVLMCPIKMKGAEQTRFQKCFPDDHKRLRSTNIAAVSPQHNFAVTTWWQQQLWCRPKQALGHWETNASADRQEGENPLTDYFQPREKNVTKQLRLLSLYISISISI